MKSKRRKEEEMVPIKHDVFLFLFYCNLTIFWVCSLVAAESTERLTIKINPSSAVAEEGDRVNLTCEFSKPTTCSWERNGGILMTNPDKGPGDPSKNSSFCSYNFASISKADFGVWRCFSHGTSILQPVFSNSVVITSKNKILFPNLSVVKPSYFKTLQWNIAAAKKEQSESLSCFFGGHTDCIWRSSESATKPFVNPTYNQSLNFTECTLRIASVKKNDIVTWECSNNYLESTQIKLSTELPANISSTNNTTSSNDKKTLYMFVGIAVGVTVVANIILLIILRRCRIWPFNENKSELSADVRMRGQAGDNTSITDSEIVTRATPLPMYEMLNASPTNSPIIVPGARPISFEIIYTKIDIPVARPNSTGNIKLSCVESTEYAQINIKQKRLRQYSKYEQT